MTSAELTAFVFNQEDGQFETHEMIDQCVRTRTPHCTAPLNDPPEGWNKASPSPRRVYRATRDHHLRAPSAYYECHFQMPTYLIHGFRWSREAIRMHIIIQDLEDAAPGWLVAPATSNTLLNSFYTMFDFLPPSNPPPQIYPTAPAIPDEPPEEVRQGPKTLVKKNTRSMASLRSLGRKRRPSNLESAPPLPNASDSTEAKKRGSRSSSLGVKLTPSVSATSYPYSNGSVEKKVSFNDWSVVKLLEQYDPNDLTAAFQPYAYVGDYMVEVTLGASLTEEMAKYESRLKGDDAPMSMPATPGSPGTPATPGAGSVGDLNSPGISARDIRRKSRRLGWFEKLRDALQKGEEIGWFVVVCGDEERATPSMDDADGRPSTSTDSDSTPQRTPRSGGMRGFFGKKKVSDEYY